MFRGGGGHHGGGGRCGGRGSGCMFTDALAQRPGLHFHEAVALPSGNRTHRLIPNAVRFIFSFHIFFTALE